ncbi:TetR family transcriptional regulator [Leucobacter sp. cx-42]|uniref:TetR family transcriptional regulator n=1 Tax=unclassified Leucobacter TaxID=2621730 RepID=UPI00165E28AA|nr:MULTISPECIES: TetR family transcriptional regulator [unclassified Leucobacter]MBC9955063.1 TetR family transcriptional regulator [Leucobacter sp. cx-42]
MRNSRADVVAAALRVLDEHGLENCSMRRVASEIGVQVSALYHHVPNKQSLLALMADEIVAGVLHSAAVRAAAGNDPLTMARAICLALRDALLAVRDGADVVATASAFHTGTIAIEQRLTELVGPDGARTLLLFSFGHAQSTQTYLQAAEFGALIAGAGAGDGAAGPRDADPAASDDGGSGRGSVAESFARGIDIILTGIGAERP